MSSTVVRDKASRRAPVRAPHSVPEFNFREWPGGRALAGCLDDPAVMDAVIALLRRDLEARAAA